MTTVLSIVSFILSGAALVFTWQTVRYGRQARESRERTQAAYEEMKRLRGGR